MKDDEMQVVIRNPEAVAALDALTLSHERLIDNALRERYSIQAERRGKASPTRTVHIRGRAVVDAMRREKEQKKTGYRYIAEQTLIEYAKQKRKRKEEIEMKQEIMTVTSAELSALENAR